MLTPADIKRLTDKTNGHWSVSPNNKDAVTEKMLQEVTETIRKRLRGMRPNAGVSVEIFLAECKSA